MADSLHRQALKDLRDAVNTFFSPDVLRGGRQFGMAAVQLERAMVRAEEALSVQVVQVPRRNDDEAP